ncbi:MAG: glycosyltransferase family 2 protein [Pseudomonadota bacterium]
MTPELSVIIPARDAQATLERALRSVLESDLAAVEIVVGVDDGADYAAALSLCEADRARIRWLTTSTPGSGPSAARNIAMREAQAPLLAFLDADDFYAPDRLSRLVPLAREQGAATGPCVPLSPPLAPGAGAPPGEPGAPTALTLERIVTSRDSFSPVLKRELAPAWRPIRFAEDMIFNAELKGRAPGYAYDPGAVYAYVQTPRSGSRGAGSLERALGGYGDILRHLFSFDLDPAARELVFRQMLADLTDFGEAYFASGGAAGWGESR